MHNLYSKYCIMGAIYIAHGRGGALGQPLAGRPGSSDQEVLNLFAILFAFPHTRYFVTYTVCVFRVPNLA